MAKDKPANLEPAIVNGDPAAAAPLPVINARPAPTPDNTPVPGGGRWTWDYRLARWVDLDAPATPATNLIQPE